MCRSFLLLLVLLCGIISCARNPDGADKQTWREEIKKELEKVKAQMNEAENAMKKFRLNIDKRHKEVEEMKARGDLSQAKEAMSKIKSLEQDELRMQKKIDQLKNEFKMLEEKIAR